MPRPLAQKYPKDDRILGEFNEHALYNIVRLDRQLKHLHLGDFLHTPTEFQVEYTATKMLANHYRIFEDWKYVGIIPMPLPVIDDKSKDFYRLMNDVSRRLLATWLTVRGVNFQETFVQKHARCTSFTDRTSGVLLIPQIPEEVTRLRKEFGRDGTYEAGEGYDY
jgi:hypothetical protein